MQAAMDRIARFFDAEYAGFEPEIAALTALAARTGGPILELGCGTGRALVPLAQAGYAVTGVDISPEMLRIARARGEAAEVADRIELVQGDFADAALAGPYRLAFVLMNTFLHLQTQADQLRALKHWRQHLSPRGLLLLDVIHPDVSQLAALDGHLEWWRTWTDDLTGHTVMKFLVRTIDLAEQVIHVNSIYDEMDAEGQVRRASIAFDLRYVWRYEAELLLDKAGFALEALYGDWNLGPFQSDSENMIIVARRRG